MKVVYSSIINPEMVTLSEYVQRAIKKAGHETIFFNNRNYKIPGRLRQNFNFLETYDLKRINADLLRIVHREKPDIFLEIGGYRILPETVNKIRRSGIISILWTIDCPKNVQEFKPLIDASPYYDYVFTGGSEAYIILKETGIKRLYYLPFACDPDFHHPVVLSDEEREIYGYEVVFIGSLHPTLYQYRLDMLETLTDFKLGIWGPGHDKIENSPLKSCIKGGTLSYEIWTKVYSASKIVLCMHYKNPFGIPCYQASPRVYEAMACKSFLVVDNQPDVMRLFKDREHLVVFKSKDELREIVQYYLNHEDERMQIAQSGFDEVLAKHSYAHRIKEMFDIVGV